MRIGVDVGGTNTDAVLMDGKEVLASFKHPTTGNVDDGIVRAISHVIGEAGIEPARIQCVMIGTTQFTNAFVERKHLLPVGVLRIALPAAKGVPPLIDWPSDIRAAIGAQRVSVRGGYQFDGSVNSPLDEKAVAKAARQFWSAGIRTVAITSLFASVNGDMETRAEQIIRNEINDVCVTLSHNVGRVGILERENATVMNASLAELSSTVVNAFRSALRSLEITAPFFISQNDGTLMTADYVEQYPVLTFASGPTNSMRGAAYLSGLKDALVVDIGGTTTDIGVLHCGFPRESSITSDIGGVRTNFKMPDVLSMGLGGGSIIDLGKRLIGPKSVGFELLSKALVFGGSTPTATDVVVAAGYADVGDRQLVQHLSASEVDHIVVKIHQQIADGVDRMKVSADPMPLVLVGGGSILVDRDIEGVSQLKIPMHSGVANAIGASIAQIGGEVDDVFCYSDIDREDALAEATRRAVEAAAEAGADRDSIETLSVEEVPLSYGPKDTVRIKIKVAGDLLFEPQPKSFVTARATEL